MCRLFPYGRVFDSPATDSNKKTSPFSSPSLHLFRIIVLPSRVPLLASYINWLNKKVREVAITKIRRGTRVRVATLNVGSPAGKMHENVEQGVYELNYPAGRGLARPKSGHRYP